MEETRPETQKDPPFRAGTPEPWTLGTFPEPWLGVGSYADGNSAVERGVWR